MEFQPLYFHKEITILNPTGDVGVLTLWSRPDWVLERLKDIGTDLTLETSRIVAIGTLYGNGIPELLRNLLYNPQIRYLLVGGRDRSNSKQELWNFFQQGTEEIECLGSRVHRILGTNRNLDRLLFRNSFTHPPELYEVGDFSDSHFIEVLRQLPSFQSVAFERIQIPLLKTEIQTKPGNLRAHVILKQKPLEAWKELVFRAVTFGRDVQLKKGKRRELQNVKVIIEDPTPDSSESLMNANFSWDSLQQYQEQFVQGALPPDTEYTYGHRLQEYYGFSTLLECGNQLRADPECRIAYVSLWDTGHDLKGGTHPCLVSIFFRKEGNRLNLPGSFRTHNIMDAWLPNCYGLIRVLREVSTTCELSPGAITMFSHSISIEGSKIEEAQSIAKSKKNQIDLDAGGDFKVDIEAQEIIVRHLYQGILVKEYRSTKAQALQHQLARDQVIFDLNHALYLGRQLANAEWCIKTGTSFQED